MINVTLIKGDASNILIFGTTFFFGDEGEVDVWRKLRMQSVQSVAMLVLKFLIYFERGLGTLISNFMNGKATNKMETFTLPCPYFLQKIKGLFTFSYEDQGFAFTFFSKDNGFCLPYALISITRKWLCL